MKRAFVGYFLGLIALAALIAAMAPYWLGDARTRKVSEAKSQGAQVTYAAPKGWSETEWPFLNDQFGKGRAFSCAQADCGADLRVTFRAKIGFCNCATGVSDDEELERIGDVEMIGKTFAPTSGGREIKVGRMAGRSRPYASGRAAGRTQILSMAFNDRCDVIVATVSSPTAEPLAFEREVLDFLNSNYVMRWAELTLGL